MGRRVLVAMSGGVDSSVAAALLMEQGDEVVGVTLHLWDATGDSQVGRCCAPEDRDDARQSCERLGVPHYVLDEREAFRAQVVEPFIDEYRAGRTPSPCVHCNRTVKLELLVAVADRFGCSHVATGHYSRLEHDNGRLRLLRGKDRIKDQSYFLFGVSPAVLSRMLFPLGEMVKDDSRAQAHRLELPNADKPDSQELCFVPDGDVRAFVARERGESIGGAIRDHDGNELGTHEGIEGFTIGQRRGLGLGGGSRPRYVLRITGHDVFVGDDSGLMKDQVRVGEATWLVSPGDDAFDAHVRIRYRHEPALARVQPVEGGFIATFVEPQRAMTPGQAAVVYRGEEVLGGGFII